VAPNKTSSSADDLIIGAFFVRFLEKKGKKIVLGCRLLLYSTEEGGLARDQFGVLTELTLPIVNS
jgi:hypothetical protein